MPGVLDLGALLENVPAIVYVARPDGSIAYANAAWERFSGLPVETVLEHGWADVLHPGDAARVGGAWLGAMASALAFREEFRIRDRGGEFRWVISHAIPAFDTAGGVAAWYGTVIPIDERRTAEAALTSLADAIPQLVWASDAAGNALHVNRRWIEYTGQSFDEALGRGWTRALARGRRPAHGTALARRARDRDVRQRARVPAAPPRRRLPLVRRARGRRARRERRDPALVRHEHRRRRPVPRRAAAHDARPARRRVHRVARLRAHRADRGVRDVRRLRRLRVRRRRRGRPVAADRRRERAAERGPGAVSHVRTAA